MVKFAETFIKCRKVANIVYNGFAYPQCRKLALSVEVRTIQALLGMQCCG